MRVVLPLGTARRLIRWTERTLLACGIVMLAYCGFVFLDTLSFQRREQLRFDALLVHGVELPASSRGIPASTAGGLIGRVEIARLGISVMVIEGTESKVLRRAAGHIPGTALPGQPGNIGISAHRDTFFRPLRNIRRDDIITVTTLRGEYRYRVDSTRIVSPSSVEVLEPGTIEVLTLVTCYPFYFVGPAPERFVVRATRVLPLSS